MVQAKSGLPAIPTGYEGLQRDISLKRKLAESMLSRNTNYQHGSWLQVLGDLANVWAGKKLEEKATQRETELGERVRADSQQAQKAFLDAINGTGPNVDAGDGSMTAPTRPSDPLEAALPFANNPHLQNNPVLEAMMGAYAERLKNRESTTGDPTRMRGPNGEIETVILDKTGRPRSMGGYQALPKMDNINGMAVDMEAQAPGTVLPQNPEALVVRDTPTNEQFRLNPLGLGAKEQLASAGAPRVQTSTFVDARDKSFGRVIPQATIDDLTTSRNEAQGYIAIAPQLREAARATKNMVTGFGANIRLGTLRAADLLGVAGKDTQERIANTQTYIRGMGKQMLPILQAMRPASDTDMKIAERMAGGDPSLSLIEIKRAVAAAERGGREAIARHRRRVSTLSKEYGSNPELSQGFKTFDVDTTDLDAADARAEAVRRELARRRGKR